MADNIFGDVLLRDENAIPFSLARDAHARGDLGLLQAIEIDAAHSFPAHRARARLLPARALPSRAA